MRPTSFFYPGSRRGNLVTASEAVFHFRSEITRIARAVLKTGSSGDVLGNPRCKTGGSRCLVRSMHLKKTKHTLASNELSDNMTPESSESPPPDKEGTIAFTCLITDLIFRSSSAHNERLLFSPLLCFTHLRSTASPDLNQTFKNVLSRRSPLHLFYLRIPVTTACDISSPKSSIRAIYMPSCEAGWINPFQTGRTLAKVTFVRSDGKIAKSNVALSGCRFVLSPILLLNLNQAVISSKFKHVLAKDPCKGWGMIDVHRNKSASKHKNVQVLLVEH